jgi:hypothetical protein
MLVEKAESAFKGVEIENEENPGIQNGSRRKGILENT